ncbi:MAG: hypothetical protein KJ574_02065, partial [Nanoarchaeota archaeon]|nr:hypothetical protein [Nanoarchaeota archaeon]
MTRADKKGKLQLLAVIITVTIFLAVGSLLLFKPSITGFSVASEIQSLEDGIDELGELLGLGDEAQQGTMDKIADEELTETIGVTGDATADQEADSDDSQTAESEEGLTISTKGVDYQLVNVGASSKEKEEL